MPGLQERLSLLRFSIREDLSSIRSQSKAFTQGGCWWAPAPAKGQMCPGESPTDPRMGSKVKARNLKGFVPLLSQQWDTQEEAWMHEGVFAGGDGWRNENTCWRAQRCKGRLWQGLMTQTRVHRFVSTGPGHTVLPRLWQTPWSNPAVLTFHLPNDNFIHLLQIGTKPPFRKAQ